MEKEIFKMQQQIIFILINIQTPNIKDINWHTICVEGYLQSMNKMLPMLLLSFNHYYRYQSKDNEVRSKILQKSYFVMVIEGHLPWFHIICRVK